MDAFLHQFQHLKIQLTEITTATNNFDEKNCIGRGGFGKVYKGEVSHSKGRSIVAIKRLDPKSIQGKPEFLKEIVTLSRYSHENIISLLGFCYQGDEMILVYEYASRGSLDRYLISPHLTWTQRLKICIDVAKGLSYLHDPRQTHQRLIHCDVKSANILLNDQWNAKVSDFGLSIMGPANEQQSIIVTMAAGTPGYCDPQYAMTHILTKESDIYSFGVVLFEVLCGALCCTYCNGRVQQNFLPTWIESYKEKRLNDIIFKNPTIQSLDQTSLEIFSDIAYRCLKESREDRPKMAEVVTELETALESQEFIERNPLFDYEEMTKTAEPPLNYRSKVELKNLLSKGVLLNSGKTWFSLNKKGEHCEMISFLDCLNSGPIEFNRKYNSRFPEGTYHYSKDDILKAHVKTQFLSPGITYTVNLVLKFMSLNKARSHHAPISLKYKLQGETKTSISYRAYEREDGRRMCELYQFTSDHRIVDFHILFDGFDRLYYYCIEVEGIEFRPLEKVEDEVSEDEELDILAISDSLANCEEKLPIDYENIMKQSKNSLQWRTKKEAYLIIRKGFLINDGQEWFSIDKNGKKCHMLSARAANIFGRQIRPLSLPESRFGEAFELRGRSVGISVHIISHLVSYQTTYATYFVYKLPKDETSLEAPVQVEDKNMKRLGLAHIWYIHLVSPRTPVIRLKVDQNTSDQITYNPVNRPKMKGLPQQRNDGCMEVQIFEFQTATTDKRIPINLEMKICDAEMLSGLIFEGIEFRPI